MKNTPKAGENKSSPVKPKTPLSGVKNGGIKKVAGSPTLKKTVGLLVKNGTPSQEEKNTEVNDIIGRLLALEKSSLDISSAKKSPIKTPKAQPKSDAQKSPSKTHVGSPKPVSSKVAKVLTSPLTPTVRKDSPTSTSPKLPTQISVLPIPEVVQTPKLSPKKVSSPKSTPKPISGPLVSPVKVSPKLPVQSPKLPGPVQTPKLSPKKLPSPSAKSMLKPISSPLVRQSPVKGSPKLPAQTPKLPGPVQTPKLTPKQASSKILLSATKSIPGPFHNASSQMASESFEETQVDFMHNSEEESRTSDVDMEKTDNKIDDHVSEESDEAEEEMDVDDIKMGDAKKNDVGVNDDDDDDEEEDKTDNNDGKNRDVGNKECEGNGKLGGEENKLDMEEENESDEEEMEGDDEYERSRAIAGVKRVVNTDKPQEGNAVTFVKNASQANKSESGSVPKAIIPTEFVNLIDKVVAVKPLPKGTTEDEVMKLLKFFHPQKVVLHQNTAFALMSTVEKKESLVSHGQIVHQGNVLGLSEGKVEFDRLMKIVPVKERPEFESNPNMHCISNIPTHISVDEAQNVLQKICPEAELTICPIQKNLIGNHCGHIMFNIENVKALEDALASQKVWDRDLTVRYVSPKSNIIKHAINLIVKNKNRFDIKQITNFLVQARIVGGVSVVMFNSACSKIIFENVDDKKKFLCRGNEFKRKFTATFDNTCHYVVIFGIPRGFTESEFWKLCSGINILHSKLELRARLCTMVLENDNEMKKVLQLHQKKVSDTDRLIVLIDERFSPPDYIPTQTQFKTLYHQQNVASIRKQKVASFRKPIENNRTKLPFASD